MKARDAKWGRDLDTSWKNCRKTKKAKDNLVVALLDTQSGRPGKNKKEAVGQTADP